MSAIQIVHDLTNLQTEFDLKMQFLEELNVKTLKNKTFTGPGRKMISIPLLKMEENTFDEVIKVNLRGTFLTNQITANAMKEFNLKGSIVNISSVSGTFL